MFISIPLPTVTNPWHRYITGPTKTEKTADKEEYAALIGYKELMEKKEAAARRAKETKKALDEKLKVKYGELTVEEIKGLLFEKKWMAKIAADIEAEAAQVLSGLSAKVLLIAKRYEHTLGELESRTAASRDEVMAALERMGYTW